MLGRCWAGIKLSLPKKTPANQGSAGVRYVYNELLIAVIPIE